MATVNSADGSLSSSDGGKQYARDLLAAESHFGELLVREGVLTRKQLALALDSQRAILSRGVRRRLGEVLVDKGLLTPKQVRQFLHLVDKVVLHCGTCGKNFNIKGWLAGREYRCPKCAQPLVPPPSADTIEADSTRTMATVASPPADESKPFGRYRLLGELGHGAMGRVWKAWDTQLKRVVALKQILGEGGEDQAYVERFMREAQLAAKLRHPNIVAVHDVGVHMGQHYFTCDYIEARSLEDAMKDDVSQRQVVSWVKDIAEALAYAHDQGVVHRDLKPANVLVDGNGQAFVMDFGLAKDMDLPKAVPRTGAPAVPGKSSVGPSDETVVDPKQALRLTASGALIGTPLYMSPEQAAGHTRKMGPATDQFALGVIMYQLLSRKFPFWGRTRKELFFAIRYKNPRPPSKIDPHVHRDLETICLKALEKHPKHRYPSMAEMAADLRRYLNGDPVLARPVPWVGRLWRRALRHRKVVLPVGAALLAAAALGTWMAVGAWKRGDEVWRLIASATVMEAQGDQDGSRQDYEAARETYKSAATLDEDSASARDGFARVKRKLDAIAHAEAEAMRLIEEGRPALEIAQAYLYDPNANYEELQKRVEEGKNLIEEARRKARQVALAHYLLGRAWKLLGWEDRAEACWREAIRRDPHDGHAHFQLGMMRLEQAIREKTFQYPGRSDAEQVQRANARLSEADKELRLAAGYPGAQDDEASNDLLQVATAYIAGDADRVLDLAAAAVERLGNGRGCERSHVLAALMSADDKGVMMAELNSALKICPREVLAATVRAGLHYENGDLDGAIADYDTVLLVNPRDAGAYNNRGCARLAMSDPDGAIADFKRAIAIDPQCGLVFYNRGLAHEAEGDTHRAVEDYNKALEFAPADCKQLVEEALRAAREKLKK